VLAPVALPTFSKPHKYLFRNSKYMKHRNLNRWIAIGLSIFFALIILGGLFTYGYLRISELSLYAEHLTEELAAANVSFSEKTDALSMRAFDLEQKTVTLSDTLYTAEQTIENLRRNLEAVQNRLGGFEQTVGEISGAVITLEKLSKTDPELLQKYSKVFFLNEHYAPERLVEIHSDYVYSDRSIQQIHMLVWPHLKDLLDAAKVDVVDVYVKSAYRSFDEQASIKSAYTVTYGAGSANQFSADQGYSEHQLGTTVDLITTGLVGELTGFEKTQAYEWMRKNAYKYGFVLSYPEKNGYYIFEPWHWRYVGINLATYLHEGNKYFYDLEQREIDEYLPTIFD